MNSRRVNDLNAVRTAREIAGATLAGELDLLQACRDMAALRTRLPAVPETAMDTFITVASEVDDLPLGNERGQWSRDELVAKDAEAADYRRRVKELVHAAMAEMITSFDRGSDA